MKVSIDGIKKLATLSRLALSREEMERMSGEFDSILWYIASIQKVAAAGGEKTRSIVATVNVVREDKDPHESGIYTEDLVRAAPNREGSYVKVKKIL